MWSRVAVPAFIVVAALCVAETRELPVAMTETPAAVRLEIALPEDVEPGSVEVELAGRDVAVVAHNARGEQIRSQPLHLSEPAVEDGVRADYEAGSLVVTLPKARPKP